MNYEAAWAFLDNLQFFKIKLGLDSMRAFLSSVGRPEKTLRYIHIAGTNGKGSVGATLLSILSCSGYRVGLYTSPHLSSVRERFRINDRYISREEFARHASRIVNVLDGRQITYFEFTTALALLWFAEQQVDLVVLEVGMGGRLDATNVIKPLVSVITNVSMDHEAYLGNTLAAVAGEKAGIIKAGVPVVAAVAADDSLAVVDARCRYENAQLYLCGRDFAVIRHADGSYRYQGIGTPPLVLDHLIFGLAGGYQKANLAVALAVVELLAGSGFRVKEIDIRRCLPKVRWPGRMEQFTLADPFSVLDEGGKASVNRNADEDDADDEVCTGGCRRFLLDGAHNPAGVSALRDALAEGHGDRRQVLVWGAMIDKDLAATLPLVAPMADVIILTRLQGERAAPPEALLNVLSEDAKKRCRSASTVREALALAVELSGPDDLICVAGSLYLIGAARALLLGELVA